MRISHWLTRLQNHRPARSTKRRGSQRTTESLERRALLTTVGILTGPTELTVFVDDGDAATVQRNATTGNVEVLDENGQPYDSIPSIQASQLTSLNIFADDADNALSVAPVNASEFSMLNSIVIESGNGDDVITGSDDFGEMIDGGDGADTITGGGGDDTIDAGDGNDVVTGGAGVDSILGDDGDDTIDGGDGNDDLDAGDGQDSVDGGAGDDVINAGDGLDTVNGGDGDDFINGMSGTDLLNGDADNDTILGGNENDTVNGGDGNDIVNGQAGNDTVNGDAGDDTAYGGGGRDSLSGGDGDDIINGQSGNDTLLGNDGSDRGYGGSGNDSLDGGAGNDTLRGHSGNDSLSGGGDSDNLDGGSGNDLIQSGDFISDDTPILPALQIDDITVNPELGSAAFSGPAIFSNTSGNPLAIAHGDLDGDGDLDLVTVQDPASSGVSVLLNDGTGSFGAPATFHNFSLLTDVELADFDGDGDLDIAATNRSIGFNTALGEVAEGLVILLNNGDATFARGIQVDVGNRADGLTVNDFDGDGDIDVAVGIIVTDQFSVVLNNGDATFAAPTLVATGSGTNSNPSRLTSADINGDGSIDIAVANNASSIVSIHLNDGAGSFGVASNFAAASAYEIEADDLDSDGDIDLVVGALSGSGNVTDLTVLFNDGTGSYSITTAVTLGQEPRSVAIGDFDGDNDLDIAVGVTGGNATNEFVAILDNDGNGVFAAPRTVATDGVPAGTTLIPFAIAAADLNGDGDADLAIAEAGNDDIWILENNAATTQSVSLMVTLSRASNDPVSVDFATRDGIALAGSDYNQSSGTVNFAPGQTQQLITVQVLGDAAAEPDENFFVELTNPVNATLADAQAQIAIVDDDGGTPGPTLSIDNVVLAQEGNTGSSNATFTVTLSTVLTSQVTVAFSTADGSATSGSDYAATSGTLTFAPGITAQTIDIAVVGDVSPEPDEVFFVNLFDPSGALLLNSRGQATVTNDDGVAPVVSSDDTLMGGSGNDTIIGDVGNDVISGGDGNDSLDGTAGNDSIEAGDGNDTIDGGSGDDTIAGQSGDDLINTGSGNDTVLWNGLGNGTDTILESEGAETLTVQGDSGVNNFDVDSNSGLLRISEGVASITVAASTTTVNVFGGSDDDTITISSIADVNALVLNVDGQADDDTISAMDANIGDVLLFFNGGTGNDTITGSRDGDSINGDGGDDSIVGGLGNDRIDGGDGNDTLNGETGNDTLLGNLGNDMALGGDGDDSLSGSFGNDTLVGEAGNDSASGGFGDDVLNGNSGDDLLAGGQDDDKLLGGSGNDSLDGDSGDDTLRGQSDDDLIKGADGNDVILGDSGNDVISGGDGDDDIDAGNGDDIVTGADGNDTINGMSGADTLLGGDGNDNQLGGAGIDSLYGENGDDSLNGGGSIDQFNGGEGADVLVTPDAGEFDDNQLAIETSVLEALELLNGF